MGPANRLYQIAKRSFIKSDQARGTAYPGLFSGRADPGLGWRRLGESRCALQGLENNHSNSIIGYSGTETVFIWNETRNVARMKTFSNINLSIKRKHLQLSQCEIHRYILVKFFLKVLHSSE